jgi:hypothetical protein
MRAVAHGPGDFVHAPPATPALLRMRRAATARKRLGVAGNPAARCASRLAPAADYVDHSQGFAAAAQRLRAASTPGVMSCSWQ